MNIQHIHGVPPLYTNTFLIITNAKHGILIDAAAEPATYQKGLSKEKKEDPARQRKNLTEVELFEHFFETIQKRSMDDREQSLLAEVLDETRREGRNA